MLVEGFKVQMKFSWSVDSKNAMIEPVCVFLKELISVGKKVSVIRCDDAGKNKALEKRCNGAEWKMNIKFEYTSRSMPQQNILVEKGFVTLANCAWAEMIEANLPEFEKYVLWREACNHATQTDGLCIVESGGVSKTRYEPFHDPMPPFVGHLQTWGEAGTVMIKDKRMSKIATCGVQCIFVGYALNHVSDMYRMFNPETKHILISQNVVWLQRMYFQRPTIASEVAPTLGPLFDDEDPLNDNPVPHNDDDGTNNEDNDAGKYEEDNPNHAPPPANDDAEDGNETNVAVALNIEDGSVTGGSSISSQSQTVRFADDPPTPTTIL